MSHDDTRNGWPEYSRTHSGGPVASADRPERDPLTANEPTAAEQAGMVRDPGRQLRYSIAALIVIAAFVIAMLLAVPGLGGVERSLRHAGFGWIMFAVGLEVLSNVGYELVVMLVFPEAPRRFAGRLAWAESAFGAAVSIGGAGSLALGAWVLHTVGVSNRRIAERSVTLFLATSAVNVIVLAGAGLGVAAGVFSGPTDPFLTILPGLVGLTVLVFFLFLPSLVERSGRRLDSRPRLAEMLRTTATGVRGSAGVLLSREWLTVGVWAYLLCDIGVLWVCLRALGQTPPFAAVILAYQIGYLTNIIPIPGNIGLLDAGLVGMLVIYGVNATPAAGAELAYHAIALWVPTIIGTLGFVLLRRQIATGRVQRRIPHRRHSAGRSPVEE